MKRLRRGPSWGHLGIACGVIAAVVVVSPAIGGPSMRSLVKQEVAKQLASTAKVKRKKARTGPQGPPGANGQNGSNGANGADGTARAYATVVSPVVTPCGGGLCSFNHSKGVTSVTRIAPGRFCIAAPGIDSATVSPMATVEHGTSGPPSGNASAMVFVPSGCSAGRFEVLTFRQPNINVWSASNNCCTNVAAPADSATGSDDVGFTVLIP
jgi:hypothetical protein